MSIAEKTTLISANNTTIAENEQKVYNAGKKSQYDEFWDCLQYGDGTKSNRKDYIGVFSGRGWNEENFLPKYNITPIKADHLFRNDFEWGSSDYNGIKDLPTCLERAGVALDFSQCTSFAGVWCFSCIEHIGVIDTQKSTSLNQTFYSAQNLHTIDELQLKENGTQSFGYTFYNCTALANITFTGKIGKDIAFGDSPLTLKSARSIINALCDYSGTDTTHTLTLSTTTKALLSDGDRATITQKGWTLA